jgi:hypothetical protein
VGNDVVDLSGGSIAERFPAPPTVAVGDQGGEGA